jgi:hemolysin-activating ACP:hemolysin acyltransferase
VQQPDEQKPDLGLMQLKDPNEALGLAVRLLAGEAPFRDMPLGFSMGGLVNSIDKGNYFFARREDRALGVTFWMYAQPEDAEAWILRGERIGKEALDRGGPIAIVLGLQATEQEVTRYLFRSLRDVLTHVDICYYLRDYGKDSERGPRAVRLIRPRIRRKPKAEGPLPQSISTEPVGR